MPLIPIDHFSQSNIPALNDMFRELYRKFSVADFDDIKTKSPWVDVRAFGASGNGTTDDTTAIQNAIDSLPATGGVVFFPEGTYLLTSALLIPSKTMFLGVGNSTILKLADNTDAELITNSDHTLGNRAVTLRSFRINGNKANQTIYNDAIHFVNVDWSLIDNIYVEYAGEAGIHLDGTSAYCDENSISNCVFKYNRIYGLQIETASDNMITNCDFYGNYDLGTYSGAVRLAGGIRNCLMNCSIVSNEKYGVFIYVGNFNTVLGCNIRRNKGHGIYVYSAPNVIIEGNTLEGNSYGGSGYDGIRVEDSTDAIITGNRCTDLQGTKTQDYGIKSTGTSDYLIVTGNNCRGNATGGISLVGANDVLANNIT